MDSEGFAMMQVIGKFLKDILTGIDNETFDNGRVICLLSYFVYFTMALGSIIVNHPWSALDFAGGIGTMGVGFGLHLKLKQDTEPEAKQ
jgi:hypothetical protein